MNEGTDNNNIEQLIGSFSYSENKEQSVESVCGLISRKEVTPRQFVEAFANFMPNDTINALFALIQNKDFWIHPRDLDELTSRCNAGNFANVDAFTRLVQVATRLNNRHLLRIATEAACIVENPTDEMKLDCLELLDFLTNQALVDWRAIHAKFVQTCLIFAQAVPEHLFRIINELSFADIHVLMDRPGLEGLITMIVAAIQPMEPRALDTAVTASDWPRHTNRPAVDALTRVLQIKWSTEVTPLVPGLLAMATHPEVKACILWALTSSLTLGSAASHEIRGVVIGTLVDLALNSTAEVSAAAVVALTQAPRAAILAGSPDNFKVFLSELAQRAANDPTPARRNALIRFGNANVAEGNPENFWGMFAPVLVASARPDSDMRALAELAKALHLMEIRPVSPDALCDVALAWLPETGDGETKADQVIGALNLAQVAIAQGMSEGMAAVTLARVLPRLSLETSVTGELVINTVGFLAVNYTSLLTPAVVNAVVDPILAMDDQVEYLTIAALSLLASSPAEIVGQEKYGAMVAALYDKSVCEVDRLVGLIDTVLRRILETNAQAVAPNAEQITNRASNLLFECAHADVIDNRGDMMVDKLGVAVRDTELTRERGEVMLASTLCSIARAFPQFASAAIDRNVETLVAIISALDSADPDRRAMLDSLLSIALTPAIEQLCMTEPDVAVAVFELAAMSGTAHPETAEAAMNVGKAMWGVFNSDERLLGNAAFNLTPEHKTWYAQAGIVINER
ncbi:hypothetical protein J8273_4894 [Carpediemonas membranifera]|uniref:Uncharacterized protein n=1 Tax=Carpediemonas membranifera TaxID=201153 RepID=A0A8J6E9N6_9EUKA|nr:hypothetical protein J8273_4894 [Carpediemonas membranifera]|eukprot:KAG9393595.1 hypothetical protein J8273_4894 [Carpediemonas membranifera]